MSSETKMSELTKQKIMIQLKDEFDKINVLRQIIIAERFNIKHYYIYYSKGTFVINNGNLVDLIIK